MLERRVEPDPVVLGGRDEGDLEDQNALGRQQVADLLQGRADIGHVLEDGDRGDHVEGAAVASDQARVADVRAKHPDAGPLATVAQVLVDLDSVALVRGAEQTEEMAVRAPHVEDLAAGAQEADQLARPGERVGCHEGVFGVAGLALLVAPVVGVRVVGGRIERALRHHPHPATLAPQDGDAVAALAERTEGRPAADRAGGQAHGRGGGVRHGRCILSDVFGKHDVAYPVGLPRFNRPCCRIVMNNA
jgi:hypothetical protein